MDSYQPQENHTFQQQVLLANEIVNTPEISSILRQTCFFIGEGSLIITCARLLIEKDFEIKGIISSDKQVQHFCLEHQLPCMAPDTDYSQRLAQTPFDYLFSVTNKLILPSTVLKLPKRFAINYHDSPLPAYAGSYATFWALANQEHTHGITWHIMDEGIDTGHILKQTMIPVAKNETSVGLNLKCYQAAIHSFEELADELSAGQLQTFTQTLANRSYYPINKRPKQGCIISWQQTAENSIALFHALDFGSYFNPIGLPKIWVAPTYLILSRLQLIQKSSFSAPGTIISIEPEVMQVATSTQIIAIKEFRTLSGQILSVAEVIEKYNLSQGDTFEEISPEQAALIEKIDTYAAKHQDYWIKKLSDFKPVQLPFSPNHTQVSHPIVKQVLLTLPQQIHTYFYQSFRDVPMADAMIAAFLIYLFKISSSTTINIGFQSDELIQKLTPIPQLFADTLPFQLELPAECDFQVAVNKCVQEILQVSKRQTYTQDLLVRHPALSTQAADYSLVIRKGEYAEGKNSFLTNALTFLIADSLEYSFVYHPQIWNETQVKAIAHQFETLLLNITSHTNQPISTISLLTQQERHQLLYEWNDTHVSYPKEKLIHQLFEQQVEKTPDAVALLCENTTITYSDLNQRANLLGRYLQKCGVSPEVMVGICMERSIEMIIGLLAILKAGGAYVPLDMNYPKERLQLMLEETQAGYIITNNKWKDVLPVGQSKLILLEDQINISKESAENLVPVLLPTHLACVIFTSGSTGKPKGVCIIHQGIVRLVQETNYARFNEKTIVLGMAPVAFDVSLCEIWGCLTNGGKLVIVPSKHPSVAELKQLIQRHQVNTWFLTVALFHLLVEQNLEELTSLKQLLTGGDVLSLTHARKALEQLPGLSLVNSYGPTENTCYSSFFPITKENLIYATVPIGRPNSNSHIYILDKWMQPVPVGIAGEIYVGGDGLARGYLNRDELTTEKFVKNPFNAQAGSHLYSTGDQGRYLPDGNIEFIGRFDNQVKIRGFRVELGEIEAVIKNYNSVSEAVVITNGVVAGEKRLIAYVMATAESNFNIEALRYYLKSHLPDYMIPAFIKQVNIFHLTPHGKIDKQRLPPLIQPVQLVEAIEVPSAPIPPSIDPLIDELVHIWKQVLKTSQIGVDDNFFELGGDSLLAVKLVSAIQGQTGYNFPVVTIFAKPTIRNLVQFIRQELNNDSWNSLVPVQPKGNKKPIFCMHPVTGEIDYVYKLAAFFDKDQPVYGLQAVGLNGIDAPLASIEEMATHYIQLILAIQAEGPYHLAGYSLGGLIAYDMAIQLKKMNKEVGILFLFDSYPHKPGQFTYLHMPIPAVVRSLRNFLLDLDIPLTHKWAVVSREVPFLFKHLQNKYKKQAKIQASNVEQMEETVMAIRKVRAAADWANRVYTLKPYPVKLVFFRTLEGPVKYLKKYDFGWKKYAKYGVDLYNLPGDHQSLFKTQSTIKILAETMAKYL